MIRKLLAGFVGVLILSLIVLFGIFITCDNSHFTSLVSSKVVSYDHDGEITVREQCLFINLSQFVSEITGITAVSSVEVIV